MPELRVTSPRMTKKNLVRFGFAVDAEAVPAKRRRAVERRRTVR
jgi:hypothetical protein